MPNTRRWLLQTGAAGALVIAAGGAGWALTRAATKAREPWRAAARGLGDPRLDTLAYAILAPSPHNLQPWRFRLDDTDSLTVFCDLERRLPATDPFDRQVTIGFGCLLELLRQAAAANGFEARVVAFPDGEPQPRLDDRPLASVTLAPRPDRTTEPLFAHVLARRTCRLAFDTRRPVAASSLATVASASVDGVATATTAEPARVAKLRQLAAAAWQVEWANTATRRESIAVTRIGKSEINATPDGIYLEGPLLEGLNTVGLLTRENMDDPTTRSYIDSLDYYANACGTAMAFCWSITATNTRADQLRAGATWVRTQLAATSAGLAFHPLSQALQEFPAMRSLYQEVHGELGASDGAVVQMLARLGYAPAVPAAPRWPLEARLMPV